MCGRCLDAGLASNFAAAQGVYGPLNCKTLGDFTFQHCGQGAFVGYNYPGCCPANGDDNKCVAFNPTPATCYPNCNNYLDDNGFGYFQDCCVTPGLGLDCVNNVVTGPISISGSPTPPGAPGGASNSSNGVSVATKPGDVIVTTALALGHVNYYCLGPKSEQVLILLFVRF